MTAFRMPSLGADMDEGTLVQWLKQPGETIQRGDIIAVVETQKGAIEIEVFSDGVLEETLVTPGMKVPVGAVLASIRTADEPAPEQAAKPAAPPPPQAATVPPVETAIAAAVSEGRKVTPAARARAAALGLDLAAVPPGGDGIIGLREVDARPEAGHKSAQGINLDEMRKAIAAAMARSKREIPHYYVSSVIDMTAISDWLAATNARRAVPDRILAAAVIIKACALGLRRVPELNGHFAGSTLSRIATIKMGIGISLRGGGLIAPALEQPDTLPLDEIMRRLGDLAARVRGGRLRSSELMDATVTLSNLGDNSADMVLPVIYPPQVAIIGAGQIAERPFVVNGALAVRKLATFSVAGDHRANDGRAAARYLNLLGEILQTPEAL